MEIISWDKRSKIEKQIIFNALGQSIEDDNTTYFEKDDIKNILHFKDNETALRFMRVAVKNGYGIKLGKTYKISKHNFKKFMKFLEGQEFEF